MKFLVVASPPSIYQVFTDRSGKKICKEINPGGGTNGADGGKVRGGVIYYVHAATTTSHILPTTPPAIINIPAPHDQHQQYSYHPTKRKRAKRGRGPRSATGGNQVWNQGGQTYYQQGGQHTGGYGGQVTGGPTPP